MDKLSWKLNTKLLGFKFPVNFNGTKTRTDCESKNLIVFIVNLTSWSWRPLLRFAFEALFFLEAFQTNKVKIITYFVTEKGNMYK